MERSIFSHIQNTLIRRDSNQKVFTKKTFSSRRNSVRMMQVFKSWIFKLEKFPCSSFVDIHFWPFLKVTSATKGFLFRRKFMFRSQYIQVLLFLKIPWFSKWWAMMSISTRDKVHFWIYLLNHNSLSHQTWPIDRYKKGQELARIFWTIWRTVGKLQVLFNLAACSNYSITNYVKIPVFRFFWKGE